MQVVPLTGGGAGAFGPLLRALRAGRLVPLLADRDLTASGVEVDLLGERARVAPGPAALALTSGAALHPVSIRYERPAGGSPRHGVVITWHPEVPVPAEGTKAERIAAMTQGCADALGAAIRQTPQDWHMLQRVFLADLDEAHRERVAP
ncbi:hypothetical protein GCM10025868_04520 [Angustibacter aerolatus]|uniref:Uncharacterized protein n=1 Tax=Angustibacter aerolatus TaxID=1162965 RepID=A0ABQ6JE71_9ACTN|nr:hypothetical protein [Angustibacter aerolatus]GMA85202.1 hypothetical protein GCM10025868_04520 [Angustibacter aerolatus]